MAIQTIKDFADQEVTVYTAAQQATAASFAAAQADVLAKQTASVQSGKDLAAAEQAVADLRRRLAAATNPGDVASLADTLQTAIAAQRSAQGADLAAKDALAEAERSLAGLTSDVDHATNQRTAATAAQKQAAQTKADHDTWATAVTNGPAKGVDTAAAAVLASNDYTSANQKLDNHFPTELRARAHDRVDKQQSRLHHAEQAAAAAQTALDTELAADIGLAGQIAQNTTAYVHAEAELKDFALAANERLDRAAALIAGVKAAPDPTQAEHDRTNRQDIVTAGKQGATDELARDDLRVQVEQKELDIEAARALAIAQNPDQDPEPGLQQLKNQLIQLQNQLGAAQLTLNQSKGGLDQWEATVPDTSWQLLDDFEEATFLLKSLARTNPYTTQTPVASLVSNLQTAEQTLAQGLEQQAERDRATWYLRERADQVAARRDAAAQNETARIFSALRGDDA